MKLIEYDRMTGWEEDKTPFWIDNPSREQLELEAENRHKTITNRYNYRVEEDDYIVNSTRKAW